MHGGCRWVFRVGANELLLQTHQWPSAGQTQPQRTAGCRPESSGTTSSGANQGFDQETKDPLAHTSEGIVQERFVVMDVDSQPQCNTLDSVEPDSKMDRRTSRISSTAMGLRTREDLLVLPLTAIAALRDVHQDLQDASLTCWVLFSSSFHQSFVEYYSGVSEVRTGSAGRDQVDGLSLPQCLSYA